MRRVAIVLAALATAAASPRVARAQGVGFEGLYQNINDVNFFFTCWHSRGQLEREGGCPSNNGYGLEVSYNIGRIRLWGGTVQSSHDTVEKTVTRANATDTIYKLTPKRRVTGNYVELEFALGYSQFSGFASKDTSYDIIGTVRELPAVAMYGGLRLENTPVLNRLYPYVGIKSGLIQLNGVQLIDHYRADSLVVYTGTAQAFQFGGVVGGVLDLGARIHLFAERAWHFRKMDNVQWASKTDRIKPNFPRSLDFSGPATTVGLQVTIR